MHFLADYFDVGAVAVVVGGDEWFAALDLCVRCVRCAAAACRSTLLVVCCSLVLSDRPQKGCKTNIPIYYAKYPYVKQILFFKRSREYKSAREYGYLKSAWLGLALAAPRGITGKSRYIHIYMHSIWNCWAPASVTTTLLPVPASTHFRNAKITVVKCQWTICSRN